MGKFLKISEAAKLTGKTETQIRRLVLTTLNHGSRIDQLLVKQKEDGDWLIDSVLLEDNMNGESGRNGEKDELMILISDQLKTKDQQIAKIQEQMSQMIERNREMNVMLHKLQQQLAIDSGKSTNKDFLAEADLPDEDDHKEKGTSSPTSFAEWARRFR